ncbi:MAG TPA: pyridoxamine 5'-phosphate oxidase [Fuerstia sp.]|nr:pyridoxamine 5'-phosphate oxidase [Fuerstiella sp.]
MTHIVSDIAFTPSVKAAQQERGSREAYERMEQRGGWQHAVTPELAAFLAQRDSFYLGTASDDGQPYIQHRGGAKGFLKVVDEKTLGFADFVGNAQYISVGNRNENNKAFIFLMDYPNRRRIKIRGTSEIVEGDDALLQQLTDDDYHGKAQRMVLFHMEAWDVNCPQHIIPRWTEEQYAPTVEQLKARVAVLERENQALRDQRDSRTEAVDVEIFRDSPLD